MEAPSVSPVSDKVKLKEIFFLIVSSPGRDLKGTALGAVPPLTAQALLYPSAGSLMVKRADLFFLFCSFLW